MPGIYRQVWNLCAVGEEDCMLRLNKLERVFLKARLGKRLGRGAEAVLVAATMIVAHVPAHGRFTTYLPHCTLGVNSREVIFRQPVPQFVAITVSCCNSCCKG